MAGMGSKSHINHSPASLLETRYMEVKGRYRYAEDQICQRAIDLYLAEVDAEYRTISLLHPGPNDDAERVLKNNVKRIQAFFDPDKCKYHRFEFAHFIARAMDELYDMGVCQELTRLMFRQAPANAETEVHRQARRLHVENGEVMDAYMEAMADGELSIGEAQTLLNEVHDSLIAASGLAKGLEEYIKGGAEIEAQPESAA